MDANCIQLVRLQLRNRLVQFLTSFYDVKPSSKSTYLVDDLGKAWIVHLQWMAWDLIFGVAYTHADGLLLQLPVDRLE